MSQGKAIAIVGLGAVLPEAPNVDALRRNLAEGRYSVSETPVDRWDPALYYDPDPSAPDKTYTKIGGWVKEWDWDPLKWRMPIPPKVAEAMDLTQKWAITAARETLQDYGYPDRPLDPDRTAVILGNAMGGDLHLMTAVRILFPEVRERLAEAPSFQDLPADVRSAVLDELQAGIRSHIRDIDEDTMPGELANITAGRIANLFDLKGPNYVTDAACASAMAAMSSAIEGLAEGRFDAVLTGGVDANMSPSTFVKFCKIGALSATGSRPFADGADGFVMGEGAATFLMKRLEDAERDGDTVYAVLRGIGASSDGRGKGITAPNPIGQKLSVRRAWQHAGLAPQPGDYVEGHGTSTKVGDVVEVESLNDVFQELGLPVGSVALGSIKSNFGHLKGAAGAAGLLKATLALHQKALPPSVNFDAPNPNIDFGRSPFRVNDQHRPWEKDATDADGQTVRRAGVSAFGFGGTNFHMVLEEHIPGRVTARERVTVTGAALEGGAREGALAGGGMAGGAGGASLKAPLRGALVIGGADEAAIATRLREVKARAEAGEAPEPAPPSQADLEAPVRLAIDYGDAAELADSAEKALAALEDGDDGRWRVLRNRGVYLGRGTAGKVAFLYTGQGSQYVNMLRDLRELDDEVAAIFDEADAIMGPIIGTPLTEQVFVDAEDEAALESAAEALKQTAITQPAVLTVETGLARLLAEYGIEPDMTMGHSLGEYGALIGAGALSFRDALMAVSARGRAMTELSFDDNGLMAAVFGPVDRVEEVIADVDGYVVIANLNSTKECVIGGASAAVEAAVDTLRSEGIRAQLLPVSHAFHTEIVAPASEPLMEVLGTLGLQPPRLPIVANVSGEFYPSEGAESDIRSQMIEILGQQIGSPVQFVKGLHTLYDAGARVFVELGPKRVLYGLVEDVLGDHDDATAVFTNHPRNGGVISANRALCALYALGLGRGRPAVESRPAPVASRESATPEPERVAVRAGDEATAASAPAPSPTPGPTPTPTPTSSARGAHDRYEKLGRMFADFMDRSFELWAGEGAPTAGPGAGVSRSEAPGPAGEGPGRAASRIGITGASLGLPGAERVFDERHIERILEGQPFIRSVSEELRSAMASRRITRLVKGSNGEARFETIDDPADVIKLAGKGGGLDLVEEYGFPEDRLPALDRATRIAIAAGLDALRDAGIPLVMRYKTTTTGSKLPDGWTLPVSMRDDTGVIFASAFPGYDAFAGQLEAYHADAARRARLEELKSLRSELVDGAEALDARIDALESEIEANAFRFDRRFLFQVLSMGHSQFAEYIGARGPNMGTNAACASATQAMGVARDWIETGRCRRVIVLSADDITTDTLFPWFGGGFLASGAAATDERVEDAALPFDRRRHGLIIGMGGAALVVEDVAAAGERGLVPICEIRGSVVANSAFHGSRLDVDHIVGVMERLVSDVEARWGLSRRDMADQMVFVSHETYTPARGGSASAEVLALRRVFGADADRIMVANTKGFTGHPMAVGIEDTLAVKMLETGVVPPVANFREVDPELGALKLSPGGAYPARFALRLAAGFGSQIAMSLLEWTTPPDGARRDPAELGFQHRVADPAAWERWLREASGKADPRLEVMRRTLRVRDGVMGGEVGVPVEVPRTPATAVPATLAATAPSLDPGPLAAAGQAPAAAPAAPAGSAGSAVQERVLAIVAEQTGYPPDMLELDLDLEADLGIDTVKQAEMFAAIREEYDIERDENLALRDYPTLARAIEFVFEKRPELKTAAPVAPATAAASPSAGSTTPAAPTTESTPAPAAAPTSGADDAVRERVLAIVAEQTGYPPDMLELDLDLEADLGIDTVKQAEMFAAIREEYDIERDENLALRDYPTLARAIEFVFEKRPELAGGSAAGDAMGPGSGADAGAAADAGVGASASSAPGPTPTTPSGHGADNAVRDKVLAIVAEQTGYPPDMLELDLDLEADLGIDTVKQAEMFAAIREEYDIERDENLALRDYPTLARAIEFVFEKRPDLAGGSAAGDAADAAAGNGTAPGAAGTDGAGVGADADAAAAPGASTPSPRGDMVSAQGVPRRVPTPWLRPGVDRFRATGVELADGDRVVVMPDEGGVAKALVGRLEKRGVIALVAETEDPASLETWLTEQATDGPIRGVYWLPALDAAAESELLEAAGRKAVVDRRVKGLYRTLRTLYEQVGGAGTFLVSATRLGGRHGYDEAGAGDVVGGAVTGLTKSFARERPDALVKAVDFAPSRKTAALADRLLDETLRDPGVVEVGYADDRRWTIGLAERAVEPGDASSLAGTFVITGAAGSITSAIVADLAAAAGSDATFWLLDLTPEPDADDPDLHRLATDRDGLKRDVFARLKEKEERATPAMVERELAKLERSRAALDAIRAVESAGAGARYRSVDLRDADAVAEVMREVAVEVGSGAGAGTDAGVTIVHAGGLEISRSLPDKSPEEFDLVFDVKVEGWFNVLAGLGDAPVDAAVVFSSIAGRFGNAGQADYSAANDLLCKAVSRFRTTRPEARGIAIDWTAWGGIGMATRGSIPTIMREAGIDMLAPEAGIPVVRRELTAGTRGEVLIAEALGMMLDDRAEAGGLDAEALLEADGGPMVGTVRSLGVHDGLVVTTTLHPAEQPFLNDHRIDGTPVLPGVMGIEAMAEAAHLPFPELHVAALEDVEFLAPFKFYREEPRTVTVRARFTTDGSDVVAACELLGERVLHGRDEPEITTHFTARVRLTEAAPEGVGARAAPEEVDDIVDAAAIYDTYFHGPAYQVLERAWRDEGVVAGRFAASLPANHEPAAPTLAAPRLVELAFQTAGLLEIAAADRMGLPAHIDRLEVHGAPVEAGGVVALAEAAGEGYDVDVTDASGEVTLRIRGYATSPLPTPVVAGAFEVLKP